MLTEEVDIKGGVANAFCMTLFELGEWRPSISGLSFESLSNVDSKALETPYSKEEVLATLGIKPLVWMASPWLFFSFVGIL